MHPAVYAFLPHYPTPNATSSREDDQATNLLFVAMQVMQPALKSWRVLCAGVNTTKPGVIQLPLKLYHT